MKLLIVALLIALNRALCSEVIAPTPSPQQVLPAPTPAVTPPDSDPAFKHRLAVEQVKMLNEVIAYETFLFLSRQGSKSDIKRLREITKISSKCSFTFTALGKDSTERFVRFMEWGYQETGFRNIICHWKKGQYLRGLDVTLTFDSSDYGVWQINDKYDWSLVPRLRLLYESGVLSYKIVRVRKMTDFMDMTTNLTMRCLVEDERKVLGMPWKHDKSPAYRNFILGKIKELESQGLYNRALVNKYYHLTPIKTYANRQVVVP